jgi:hypothetical protein
VVIWVPEDRPLPGAAVSVPVTARVDEGTSASGPAPDLIPDLFSRKPCRDTLRGPDVLRTVYVACPFPGACPWPRRAARPWQSGVAAQRGAAGPGASEAGQVTDGAQQAKRDGGAYRGRDQGISGTSDRSPAKHSQGHVCIRPWQCKRPSLRDYHQTIGPAATDKLAVTTARRGIRCEL